MGKRANGCSKGLKTTSGKQHRALMISRRQDALVNSRARDFEQEDAVDAPGFRLFNAESDGAIVSWFHVREADYEVEHRVVDSRLPLVRHELGAFAADFNFYEEVIEIPKRPAWSPKMSRRRLVKNEESYFAEYLQSYVWFCSLTRFAALLLYSQSIHVDHQFIFVFLNTEYIKSLHLTE